MSETSSRQKSFSSSEKGKLKLNLIRQNNLVKKSEDFVAAEYRKKDIPSQGVNIKGAMREYQRLRQPLYALTSLQVPVCQGLWQSASL